MKIFSNIKFLFLFATALICCAISYPLLNLVVHILNDGNILASLITGFIVVPLGIGIFIASILSALSLFVRGLIFKTKVWWILGVLLMLANVGAVVYAFLV